MPMDDFTLKIEGWREGFQKVQASRLLRDELGISLGKAKNIVDQILVGDEVILVCSTSVQVVSLGAKPNGLGANVSGF